MVEIRPVTPADRAFVFSLAPRLKIGKKPWRDDALWLAAVRGWLAESTAADNKVTAGFIAQDKLGQQLGFASVTLGKHFTGQPQAIVGELATSEKAEGRGIGTALVEACERWAHEQGVPLLVLTTGAENTRALAFYHRLGFHDEEITLTKLL